MTDRTTRLAPNDRRAEDDVTTAEIFLDDVHDERELAERTRAKVRNYLQRRRAKLRAARVGDR
ncbi:MAG: hypothetical protein R3343_11520 [Nitriliruptorales bacterium]|nr:hypothetical protein [Nitriliruptorales bacterium]